MDKDTRSNIERATQRARRVLEEDFADQLEGTYDVMLDGRIAQKPGAHLNGRQKNLRSRIVAAIEHKRLGGMSPADTVKDYLRDAAFTALNRFAALKMLEARELVQECITRGDASAGYAEFCGLASGVRFPDGSGYRLYIESIFDELSTEVKVLFDRRDPASALWLRRAAFEDLLEILNADELKNAWAEDETIGWVYQYFNSAEERRQMREASPAPRNGRDLAVRNQFFTPRYVVQFLTDNTLGRIWYEMRRGKTSLAESCEYMVRYPREAFAEEAEDAPIDTISEEHCDDDLRHAIRIPHRSKKDPRDIRILDPACGSGHFLLYCFSLLLTIYEEAWADHQSPASLATGRTLREDFPSIEELRLALPRLALKHNLHGIDIDPRCAQIAQLALWMRAQRAYRDFGIVRTERPTILRVNIVIAEPMPGEKDLLAEFLQGLKEDRLEALLRRALDVPITQKVKATKAMAESLAGLITTVWDGMSLAGEIGSLLKIERDLARAIENGRNEWEDRLPLFRVAEYGIDGRLNEKMLRVIPSEHQDFWTQAEKLVFQALAGYSTAVTGIGLTRRRLFAEDAAQGFSFVDLMASKFDVVLTNPPFGAASLNAQPYITTNYPIAKADILAAFVQRCRELAPTGYVGAITNRTCLFITSLAEWRRSVLLSEQGLVCLADLGHGVLDGALVEAACYVLGPNVLSVARGFLNEKDKDVALRTSVTDTSLWNVIDRAVLQASSSAAIPYWAPEEVLRIAFESQTIADVGLMPRVGLQTSNDFRFLRLQWEVSAERVGKDQWVPFAKGGEYSPFADNIHLAVNWFNSAKEQKAFAAAHAERTGSARGNDASRDFEWYLQPGLTYSERTTSDISVRALPEGCITGTSGPGIYCADHRKLLPALGYFSSATFRQLLELSIGSGDAVESGSAARHYTVGAVAKCASVGWSDDHLTSELALAAARAIQATRKRLSLSPIAPLAVRNHHLGITPSTLTGLSKSISARIFEAIEEILTASYEIEKIVSQLFGENKQLDDFVVKEVGIHPCARQERNISADEVVTAYNQSDDALIDRVTAKKGYSRTLSKKTWYADRKIELICSLLDVHPRSVVRALMNAGVRPYSLENAAYDLIEWALGSTLGNAGQPEVRDESLDTFHSAWALTHRGYSKRNAVIAVDDLSHPADIVESILSTWRVHGWRVEPLADDIRGVLNGMELREFLAKKMFAIHITRFSQSRRKAPIYWQLATSSSRYSIWLYIHNITRDTFFRVQTDYVAPKLAKEQRQLEALRADAGANPGNAQRRAIEAQEGYVEELQAFLDEVKRVAPLWNPNLDDGVIINFSPLWRLVPQHRGWQKELRSTWEAIVTGEYDWCHLAMHLWPERVVPKCATDRSLAVAHDLEEIFWFEDQNGKWKPRDVLLQQVNEIVRERTSPAVKEALKSLLEAPETSAPTKRTRKRAIA